MEQAVPIFVSYAREDSKIVFPILDRLRAEGFQCWVDQEGIEGAAFWRKEIVKVIDMTPVVLFFASQTSCHSDNVFKELALASEERKPILPVFLDTVRLPAELRYQIAGLQHVNWHDDPERALSQISVALRHYTSPSVVSEPVTPHRSRRLRVSRRAQWLVIGIAATGVIALVVTLTTYRFFGSPFEQYVESTRSPTPINTAVPLRALVIGNQRYPISPLRNPIVDAQSMTDLLKRFGFSVTELLDGTEAVIHQTLSEHYSSAPRMRGLATPLAIDSAVYFVYYSGHAFSRTVRSFLRRVRRNGAQPCIER